MARKTPERSAAKWARNTAASQQDWKEGVEAVTDNPMAKAAAAAGKWQTNVSAPDAREKFSRNTGRVSAQDWKDATVQATGRFAQGVGAAEPKMLKHQQEIAGHMEALKRKIDAMPNTTAADKDARMLAWAQGMRSYRKPA